MVGCHELEIRHSRALDSNLNCVYMAGIWQLNQLISQNSELLPLKSDIFTKFRIPQIYSFDQWESKRTQ